MSGIMMQLLGTTAGAAAFEGPFYPPDVELYISAENGISDDGPNGHTITNAGGASISTTGDALSVKASGDQSIFFNGQNNAYIYAGSNTFFNDTLSSWQFQCWANARSSIPATNDTGQLIDQYDGGVAGRMIFGFQDSGIDLRVNGGTIYLTSGNILSGNTWYHVCLNWDGTTHRLFIDGDLKDSATNVPAIYTGKRTEFGGGGDLSGYDLYGYMDDILVENQGTPLKHNFVPNNVGYLEGIRSFIFFGGDTGNASDYEASSPSDAVEIVDFGNKDGWTPDLNFYATSYRATTSDSNHSGGFDFSLTTSNSNADPTWGILAFDNAEPRQYVGPDDASSLTMNNIRSGSALLVLAMDTDENATMTPPTGFTEIINYGAANTGTNGRAFAAWKENASSSETVSKVGDVFMLLEIATVGDPNDVAVSLLGNSYGNENSVSSFTATAPSV